MNNKELLLAISDMLDEKLEKKLEEKLDAKLDEKLEPIKVDIRTLKDDVSDLKDRVSNLETDMKEVKNEQVRMNLVIKNEIRPDIKLLVENYVPAARKYERSVSKIEDMQMDIRVMKGVITEHSELLQGLV